VIESQWARDCFTGPGAYQTLCKVGTRSLPGVRRPGRAVKHPHPQSDEIKISVLPSGLQALLEDEFIIIIIIIT